MINNKNDLSNIPNYNSINDLSGIEFENLCKDLLQKMGFYVETTKASGDGGIDLIANNSQPFLEGRYIVQCKRYAGSVGEPIIRDLYGVVCSERANKGILITTGTFTNSAVSFAQGKNIELIDGKKLAVMLSNYNVTWSNSFCNEQNNLDDIIKRFKDNEYDYDEYNTYVNLTEEVRYSPKDNEKRARLIVHLLFLLENLDVDINREEYFESLSCLNLSNEEKERLYENNKSNFLSLEEKTLFCAEIKKHCEAYVNNSKSIDVMEIEFMTLSMQLSFFVGDFNEAYNHFVKISKLKNFSDMVLYSEKSRNTGLDWYFYNIVFNCVQMCCIANDILKAERIINKYKKLIDEKTKHWQNMCVKSPDDSDYQEKYRIAKNITTVTKWFGRDYYNIKDIFEYVYEIGENNFFGGQEYQIITDVENNTLTLSYKKSIEKWGHKYVINNLSESIRRFKNVI